MKNLKIFKKLILKTTFILLVMVLSISAFAQELPKSLPNNGHQLYQDWSISDYKKFVTDESIDCPKLIKEKINVAREKLKQDVEKIKYDSIINRVSPVFSDAVFVNRRKSAKKEFEDVLKSLENYCALQFEKNSKYRDEWIAYLDATAIQDNLDRIKFDKDEKERKRMEDLANFEKQKLDEQLRIDNLKKLLNSIEYKTWKAKYVAILKSAYANVMVMDNLENKYSFRNNFGKRVWDSNRFSKQDRLIYNKNYDAIGKKLDQIRELQHIGENDVFERYYIDVIIASKKIDNLDLYNLGQYYGYHERI